MKIIYLFNMWSKFVSFFTTYYLAKKKEISEQEHLYLISQLSQLNFKKTYFYSLLALIKNLKNNYENKKITQGLEQFSNIKFNIDLLKKDKIKIMKTLCFERYNLDQDREALLVLKVLDKVNFKFDDDTSSYFYTQYLFSRIKSFYEYKVVFTQLESLGFNFNKIQYQNKQLINRRIFESLSIEDFERFNLDCGVEFRDFNYRTHFLIALSNAKNCDNLSHWISYFLSKNIVYKSDTVEFLLLLKIYSNSSFHEKLGEMLLKEVPEDSFLHSLIKEKYNFSHLELRYKYLLDRIVNSKTLKEFVQESFNKSNRHLVSLISTCAFKDKIISFSFIKFLTIFKDEDINYLYTMIADYKFYNLKTQLIEDEEFSIIKHIADQLSWERKREFLLDVCSDFYLFRELKINYSQILLKNQNFKIEIKYTTLPKLINYISNQHRQYYFQNHKLFQLENFPILNKLDGLVVDDLRFEIPKNKYDLYTYGNIMVNCIYTYSEKCEVQTCILIGVYKDGKLEYNIELGTNYFENHPLTALYGQPIVYGTDRFMIGKLDADKKRRVIQFEKKYKQPVPIDDHKKILKILTDLDIID